MRTKNSTKLTETITAAELAELSNLSQRRIYQLVEEKRLPPAVKGRFPLQASVRQLFQFYQRDGETLQREKMLKTAAERKLREHELATTEGKLINRAIAERTLSAALKRYHGIVRTELERLEIKKLDDFHISLGLSDEHRAILHSFHLDLARKTIDKVEDTCELIGRGELPAQVESAVTPPR